MTVLQVLRIHPYKLGSFEAYILTFAKKMFELGNKVIFFFAGEPHPFIKEQLQRFECRYFVGPTSPKILNGFFSFFYKLIVITHRYKVHVIHGQFHPYSHYAVLAGFVTRTPSFRTVRSTTKQGSHAIGVSQIIKARISAVLAQKTFAVSNAVREDLINKLHVPAKEIEVLYNGIDLEKYSPRDNDFSLHKELQISEDSQIVISVAHARPEKGLDYLIKAMPIILQQIPKTHFVFCGGGPLEDKLIELGKRVGVSGNIHFLGIRNDVPHLLNDSCLFVLPSLAEPFGLAIIEAMAMKKAVVATGVDGILEVVQHGKTGILIPPRDPGALAAAIIELLRDPEKVRKMGIAGRKRVEEHFEVNHRVLKEIKIYENLLK